MGWYFTQDSTLKGMIAELCEGWERTYDNGKQVKAECITKCFRGAVTHSGVLWGLWKHTVTEPDGTVKEDVWIRCDLMQRQNGYGWGHKPMEESCGPFFYNCPESYLKKAPVTNERWREGVAEYHKKRRASLAARKAAEKEWMAKYNLTT